MKKRFLGIPVVLIVCVLALLLAGGIAYAAVNLLSGAQATVQISEAITIDSSADPSSVVGGNPGTWTSAMHGDTTYTNTWVLGTPDAPVWPNYVATMPIVLTNISDVPVAVSIRVVPKFFPGSNFLADGVSMTIDDTGMMVNDPTTGTAVPAGAADLGLFGPTTSVVLTLEGGGADTVNVTFVAGNDAVAGAYAFDIIIERGGLPLPTPA